MKQLLKLVLVSIFLVSPLIVHADPAAKVTCMDGATSKAGKGACSKHGGVNKAAATEATVPAAEAPAPTPPKPKAKPSATTSTSTTTTAKSSGGTDAAGATAQCKDGSYSHAKTHTGACSKHGGVASWLDK